MRRSIAARQAVVRHLRDDGICEAVGPEFVAHFFDFGALVLLAEIGTWAPASYCQTPRNRREPTPQSLRARVLANEASIDAREGQVCSVSGPTEMQIARRILDIGFRSPNVSCVAASASKWTPGLDQVPIPLQVPQCSRRFDEVPVRGLSEASVGPANRLDFFQRWSNSSSLSTGPSGVLQPRGDCARSNARSAVALPQGIASGCSSGVLSAMSR